MLECPSCLIRIAGTSKPPGEKQNNPRCPMSAIELSELRRHGEQWQSGLSRSKLKSACEPLALMALLAGAVTWPVPLSSLLTLLGVRM